MSYARWGFSFWYIFWQDSSSEVKEEQLLSIDCKMTFTYKQLKESMENCLILVKEMCEKDYSKEHQPRNRDMKELKFHMESFIEDMDERYGV